MEGVNRVLTKVKELQQNMRTSEAAQNVTSEKRTCPYGLCDGSGMIIYNKEGYITTKPCKCAEDEVLRKRLKFAEIPQEFKDLKVNDFATDIYTGNKDRQLAVNAKKIVIGYVKNFDTMAEMGKGLYFYSSTKGSGKTRLAVSMGNALINKYRSVVKFTTTIRLLNEIKDTFDNKAGKTQAELIADTTSIQVLLLDDIGVEKPTPWAEEVLYTILNERMICKKITIFTSNLSIDELKLDERIRDRIKRMAMPVMCPEESVRQILASKENDEIMKKIFE